MTYQQTVAYLYSRLPMFTKVGASAFKTDIDNTVIFCNSLGNPQNRYKTIHIGGTNGKGSTSHMLAAILHQAGYKTGLYTSPHLKDFRERIRINGKMISKKFVRSFVQSQKQLISEVEPSFFEVTVAMAFSYFEQEQVDVGIIEVGLGGRLDSTNIINPDLSVITNISLDHTNILGDTLAEIAFEKAGIIKPTVPAIIGEHQPQTDQVFIKRAAAQQSTLTFAPDQITTSSASKKANRLTLNVLENGEVLLKGLQLDLTGSYQLKNVVTVIQAVQSLRTIGYQIDNDAIYFALLNVKKLTGLQGRWQTLSKKPLVICDTGHNKAGIKEVVQNIKQTPHEQLHMVIGMVKDKDISAILALLPKNAIYYFCQPLLERALPAMELAQQAAIYQLGGKIFETPMDALNFAKSEANDEDLIFVGGSTFVVAEVL